MIYADINILLIRNWLDHNEEIAIYSKIRIMLRLLNDFIRNSMSKKGWDHDEEILKKKGDTK